MDIRQMFEVFDMLCKPDTHGGQSYSQTFKYSILDAVPPIHGESYHVATDKDPSMPPSWRQVPVYF